MLTKTIRAIAVTVMAFLCLGIIHPTPAIEKKADVKSTPETSSKVSSKIYFSLGNQYNLPSNEGREHFSCSDKIFTVVELNNLPKTKYNLSIVWKDPTQTERERSEFPFTVARAETKLWTWLSLAPSDGAAMIQWINPAAGLEEFIGLWSVDILINNRKIATKSFEVIC